MREGRGDNKQDVDIRKELGAAKSLITRRPCLDKLRPN